MLTINDIEKDEQRIKEFTESLLESLNDNVAFAKIRQAEEINAQLKQINRILAYYAKVEKTEHNIHFARGRLVGVTEIYNGLIELSEGIVNRSRRVDDVFAAIKTVSHGEEVLDSLSQVRGIRHKELSNIIGIDASTLTGIMDKLENLRLVYYTKVGKFKFYYLSEVGQSYKDEKKAQPQIYIKELEEQLKEERKKNRQLERDRLRMEIYLKLKTEIRRPEYFVELWDKKELKKEINKISNREKDFKRAQKVFDKWNKESNLRPSNLCGDFI